MNRYVLSAISLLLLTLTGCSDSLQESTDTSSNGVIRLTTSIEKRAGTRGTPVTSASSLSDMGLYCYHTGFDTWSTAEATATPNKMNHTKWTQSAGVWSSESPVTWGTDVSIAEKFTFWGYAPYATGTGSEGNGLTIVPPVGGKGFPKLTYTVPTDITKQPDLMVAVSADKHVTPNPVNLAYKHALTCIAFKAKGSGQKITAVKVKGVSATGTLSVDAAGTPTWSNLSAPGTIEYTAGLNSSEITTAPTSVDILNADGYLMMIPQTLTADAQLVVTVDGNNQTFNLNTQSITTWAAGQILTYTIETKPPTIVVDYSNLESSNCYIINPNTSSDMIYRIPVRRVNEVYNDPSNTYGMNSTTKTIGETDSWSIELGWSSVANMIQAGTESTIGITISKSTGVGTKGSNESDGDGWFEIRVPSTMNVNYRGNVLVNVCKSPYSALWSFHLWVTDYNPYGTPEILEHARTSGGDNGEPWVWTVPGGKLFKMRDGTGGSATNGILNPWSTKYANKKMMDRPIGFMSTPGVLMMVYQFGRNVPFPSVNGSHVYTSDLYKYGTQTTRVYTNPNAVSMDYAISNYYTFWTGTVSSSLNDWCATSQLNTGNFLWHDPKVACGSGGKSVFDPSPLGFKMVENGAFSALKNSSNVYITNTSKQEDGNIFYTRSSVAYTEALKIPIVGQYWIFNWTSSPAPTGGFSYLLSGSFVSNDYYRTSAGLVWCVEE